MVNRMDRLDSGPRRNSRSGGGGGASSSATNRIPPHNLQAEESVLGAILLSRDALGSVIEQGLRYDDFYKPAHQHIYDAACAVSQSGGPADTITVADELERLGLLEQCGGVEALHGLQNATPAISNAGHYAKIVQDAAMLRRLIMVSGDITELAYSRPENVDDALDEAETKIFKVADRRVSDTYIEIGELMKGAIERIEENFTRGDTITGVATGYSDLDEMLSGLQPSTLNIVGARPAMEKLSGSIHRCRHQQGGRRSARFVPAIESSTIPGCRAASRMRRRCNTGASASRLHSTTARRSSSTRTISGSLTTTPRGRPAGKPRTSGGS